MLKNNENVEGDFNPLKSKTGKKPVHEGD